MVTVLTMIISYHCSHSWHPSGGVLETAVCGLLDTYRAVNILVGIRLYWPMAKLYAGHDRSGDRMFWGSHGIALSSALHALRLA